MKSTLAKGHAVLEGAEIIYLDKFNSPLRLTASVRIRARAPACCVASGKTLRARPQSDNRVPTERRNNLAMHDRQQQDTSMNQLCTRLRALAVAALATLTFATPWRSMRKLAPTRKKPIRFIVPYPPGGGTDVIARIVQERFQAGSASRY